MTSTTNPDGSTTLSAYDQDGRLSCSVSPIEVAAGVTCPTTESVRNRDTQSETFNGDSQVTTSTDPAGNVTQTLYDVPLSNPLSACVPTTAAAAAPTVCARHPFLVRWAPVSAALFEDGPRSGIAPIR